MLPRGKQRMAWAGEDTLLVSREWNAGELTKSGYPFIVKRLIRGQPLSAAVEIFRGAATDGGYGVSPVTLADGSGHRVSFIDRPTSTFEAEHYIVRTKDVAKLAMPLKATFAEFVGGQVIVQLAQEWTDGAAPCPGRRPCIVRCCYRAGDPGALGARGGIRAGPTRIGGRRDGDARPSARQRIPECERPCSGVQPRPRTGVWTHVPLSLPDNVSTNVASADQRGDDAFVSVTGLPHAEQRVARRTRGSGSVVQVKTLPPKFDASHDVVEQLEATSSDGTKVPYFVVHPTTMKRDGANPTILYAYGGFEISLTPSYSAEIGKLWLEQGGVYVLANIRGGGEFGPAWHEAGLKTHRQLIYDDFAAVARDLIARKITSRAKLGIQGGSNGGLLMGVELTQHPELWNAVDIQVPLLDMLRYRADRGRHVLGRRIRQRGESQRARVPRVDLTVRQPQARREIPGAVHLDHHQGRPGGSAARAEVRREDVGDGAAVLVL